MDLWISYSSSRETRWTGHPSKAGVRRAILYAVERGRALTIFRGDDAGGPVVYTEIPYEQWDATFAD
ncbi:hypothetical protein [Streptomyces sp. CB03911]|uniref:hypothetical protein n=1 Tax=Streptomyces sp. CB03911 TaxID=1804758 RepID=UPI00093E12D5|nr:hypothetical protein [Streptomyces sp. CB03911]OKI19271.1 hypothetical protein A6A07_07155 [Streptomyces sp. CB03911]